MKSICRLLTVTLILVFPSISAFAQWRYFVQLIFRNEKKVVQVVERTSLKEERIVLENEDHVSYDYFKNLSKGEKLEIPLTAEMIDKLITEGKMSEVDAIHERQWVKIRDIIRHAKVEDDPYAMFRTGVRFDFPTLYISIPSNEDEYLRIFKKFNRTQFDNTIKRYNKLIEDNKKPDYLNTAAKPLNSSKNFISVLSETSDQPLVLIGHNENGLVFFPDGSSISIKDIDSVAKKFERIIVYLTCNSMSYTENPSVDGYLTYDQALAIGSKLAHMFLGDKKDVNQKIVKDEIQKEINSYQAWYKNQDRFLTSMYIVGAGGVAYGVYEIKKKN